MCFEVLEKNQRSARLFFLKKSSFVSPRESDSQQLKVNLFRIEVQFGTDSALSLPSCLDISSWKCSHTHHSAETPGICWFHPRRRSTLVGCTLCNSLAYLEWWRWWGSPDREWHWRSTAADPPLWNPFRHVELSTHPIPAELGHRRLYCKAESLIHIEENKTSKTKLEFKTEQVFIGCYPNNPFDRKQYVDKMMSSFMAVKVRTELANCRSVIQKKNYVILYRL